MHDKRAERYASHLGILDRMEALETDLTAIPGVGPVDFDIDLLGYSPYVIVIPRYDVDLWPVSSEESPVLGWFARRRQQLHAIIDACTAHDLSRTEDNIEDYGAHWYIVFRCGNTWPKCNA